VGYGYGEELHHYGCGYVGHNPEGEDRHPAEVTPGEDVVQVEERPLYGREEVLKSLGVNPGYGYVAAQTVYGEHHERVDKALP